MARWLEWLRCGLQNRTMRVRIPSAPPIFSNRSMSHSNKNNPGAWRSWRDAWHALAPALIGSALIVAVIVGAFWLGGWLSEWFCDARAENFFCLDADRAGPSPGPP